MPTRPEDKSSTLQATVAAEPGSFVRFASLALTARVRTALDSVIVPLGLGLVLLLAAALKTEQLATGHSMENSFFTSRWSLTVLIELELALGLWLLVGLYAPLSRRVALACFSAFAAVSFQQALSGKASCSCFGAVSIRPWSMFLFDLVAIAALWFWHPKRNTCAGTERRRSALSWRAAGFGLLCVPAGILMAVAGAQASPPALTALPQPIDVGTVQLGGWKQATFTLTNSSTEPLAVARIETSCPCLKIQLPKAPVAPGEITTCGILIDLRTAPVKPGRFSLEASGFAESRTGAVFTIRVDLTILN